jgi:ketosteroid isomerase-like protein
MNCRLIIILIAITFSCNVPTDIEQEKAEIITASLAFSQAYVGCDLEKQMSFYTDDIVNIPGSRPMLEGKKAVTEYWTRPATNIILEHRSIPTEIEIIGKMAKDYGYYEGKSVRNGDTSSFKGQYLITWRKESDGKWRMSADMWSGFN